MANDDVNRGRRRFLTASTAVVGGIGVVAAAVPFIKSWQPSARALSAGAPVKVDITKIEEGQLVRYNWASQPVFVVNRTKQQLATLDQHADQLADPESKVDQQPPYANNKYRSIKPEWLVVIGICTHLGCVPDYYGEVKPEPWDPQWPGGFYCPCHKSRYDMSARVFQGVPAPKNMVVPPYHFIDDTHIEVGVGPKGAA